MSTSATASTPVDARIPTRLPNRCTTTPETVTVSRAPTEPMSSMRPSSDVDRSSRSRTVGMRASQLEKVMPVRAKRPMRSQRARLTAGGGVAHVLAPSFWLRIESIRSGAVGIVSNRFEGRRHSAGTLAAASNLCALPARRAPLGAATPNRRSDPVSATPHPGRRRRRRARLGVDRLARVLRRRPDRRGDPSAGARRRRRARLLRAQPPRSPAAPGPVRDRRRRRRRLAAPRVPRPRLDPGARRPGQHARPARPRRPAHPRAPATRAARRWTRCSRPPPWTSP